MFSHRTAWPRIVNAMTARTVALLRSGAPILDLTESNPTRVGLRAPASILALLADPQALAYDPAPLGSPAARAAVAADFARRGAAVAEDAIVLTASSSEAYGLLFKLLCDPRDRVLAPQPSYPLFDYLAGLESVTLDPYPLDYDGEWHLSVDSIEERVTPRTRAVVVVHPNNPTGSFLKRNEVDALLGLCARRGLAIVSDEVFDDYPLIEDPRRHGSLAGRNDALVFALGGLSKSCALPQLKLGWIAIAGPAALREEARERLEIVADTYLSVSTPVQAAAPEILARRHDLQGPVRARLAQNLAHLARSFPRGGAAELLRCEGGWSAVLRVPSTSSDEEWVESLLDEQGVLVHPGYFFELPRGFLVLSLLPEEPVFREGVSRLAAHVGLRS